MGRLAAALRAGSELGGSLQPDVRGAGRYRPGQGPLHRFAMEPFQIVEKEADSKRAIVLEEGSQEVGLTPGTPVLDRLRRELEWVGDVVEVNPRTDRQERNDIEEQQIYIAPHLRDMRGVDEEDVSRPERVEHRKIDVLQEVPDDRDAIEVSRPEELQEAVFRKRVDEGAIDRAIEESVVSVERQR